MKILKLLSLAAATAAVMFTLPLSAQEAAPVSAPTTTEPTTATESAAAPAAVSRPLPKMRQGTPFTADRKKLIIFSTLFFFLSVFMASVVLRTKEDIPA